MGILEALKAAAFAAAGAAVGWALASFYGEIVTLPAAREAGRQEMRVEHEEQRRKAEAEREAERAATQATIDEVERAYHQRTAEQATQLDALEASIAEETSRAHVPTQADAQAGAHACPAAVPRSLRDALARVGADSAGDDTRGASPSMR